MSRALDFSVGELLGKSELADFYTRVEYDRSGNIIYTPLWLEDGEKKVVDFFSHYHIGNHNLSTSSIKLYIELFKAKSNFSIYCERADKNNKTILGFLGSKYKQKFWLVECNICGSEAVQDMKAFPRCKSCSEISKTKPFEQFRLESCEKHSNKYSYDTSSYKNNKIKTKIFCTKCQIHFLQRPYSHLAGDGCPFCRESKGEQAVLRYCIENNIRFERYKKFNGLIYKKQLNYDFYLIDENILVEFDGDHHRKPIVYNGDIEGAQKKFVDVQNRDMKKNQYAYEHNIPLLRISTLKKVVEDLDNFRAKYNNV